MEDVWCISITLVSLLTIGDALSDKTFLALIEEPDDTVFNIDSNKTFATFHCKSDGNPTPDITWLANEQMIMENNLYNVTEEGSLLVSYPPKNLNGSSYRCIASNSFGTVMSRAATLEIAYVDTFPAPSAARHKRLNAKLGTCITCNPPDAYPGIHADWKAGVSTDINSNDRIREMIDGRLCFAYTTTGDRGTYFCVVSNKYDKGEATKRSPPLSFYIISVGRTSPSQNLEPAPGIREHVTVKQGQEAVLECFFLGKPTPTLEWTRRDADLPINSTQLKYNQELRIPNAQPQDNGEYQCIGASRGYSETVSRYLTVLAPPNLVSGLKDEKVDSGSTVTMQCTADDDGVEFSWYHNTRLINSSMKRPRISEDNTLTIDNVMVQDSGIYQCAARNGHGMSLSTAQLSVEEQEPTEMKPTESEIDQPDSRSPGNTVGDTFVYIFAAMVSAALLEIL